MEITIPKKLAPVVQAFAVEEKAAKFLIREAARAIHISGNSSCDEMSNEDLEGVIMLMKGIDPKDTLEMLYGAQIVIGHLTGVRLLGTGYKSDQVLGLKLLRFSNDAMIQLQKKRAGGSYQNVNITYNHVGVEPVHNYPTIPLEDVPCQSRT